MRYVPRLECHYHHPSISRTFGASSGFVLGVFSRYSVRIMSEFFAETLNTFDESKRLAKT